MKYLELDIDVIRRIGERKEDENFEFRAFLKGQDSDKIDKIVLRLNKDVSARIDCQKCGNCCMSLRPLVSKSEIKKLSATDNLSVRSFENEFVEEDELGKVKYLKDVPCKYLSCKSCSIYEDRPKECQSYPFLHKDAFVSRTLGVIDNYSICPIVYNVYEILKEEMRFERY